MCGESSWEFDQYKIVHDRVCRAVYSSHCVHVLYDSALSLTSVYGRWPLTHRHCDVLLYLRTLPADYMYSSHCAQILNVSALSLTSDFGRWPLTHWHYDISLYLRTLSADYMYSSHCSQVLNDFALSLTSVKEQWSLPHRLKTLNNTAISLTFLYESSLTQCPSNNSTLLKPYADNIHCSTYSVMYYLVLIKLSRTLTTHSNHLSVCRSLCVMFTDRVQDKRVAGWAFVWQ